MRGDIPVSVIVVARNEEKNLPRCLSSLSRFSDVVVVDSGSTDNSRSIVESFGAEFVSFQWNGRYPKKRQWCLDNLSIRHDFVFFIDADEEATPALCDEIAALDFSCAGYFVKGLYVMNGRRLRFGLKNSKLCLFNRHKMEFPVVDDLDLFGMGEIEGHYQPVFKKSVKSKTEQLRHGVLHHAYDDEKRYLSRHEGYRKWEQGMQTRKISDPVLLRRIFKKIFICMPWRDIAAFLHSYILLAGFLDGGRGYRHAKYRYDYYTARK